MTQEEELKKEFMVWIVDTDIKEKITALGDKPIINGLDIKNLIEEFSINFAKQATQSERQKWQKKTEALEKIVDKKIGKNTDERLTQFYFVVKDAIDKILKEGK